MYFTDYESEMLNNNMGQKYGAKQMERKEKRKKRKRDGGAIRNEELNQNNNIN